MPSRFCDDTQRSAHPHRRGQQDRRAADQGSPRTIRIRNLADRGWITGHEAGVGMPSDLILMDIQLPEISGLDVTRRLKGDERSQNIPIIAVTALGMEWHEKEALDSGCDAYISKPFSISDFLHTVGSFLPRFPH